MHYIAFGEREGLADKPPDSLSQGVVPSLSMISLPTVFADTMMFACRNNSGVCFPIIAVGATSAIGVRN